MWSSTKCRKGFWDKHVMAACLRRSLKCSSEAHLKQVKPSLVSRQSNCTMGHDCMVCVHAAYSASVTLCKIGSTSKATSITW